MSTNIIVFAGTYTEPMSFIAGEVLKGKGIHAYNFDTESGTLSELCVNEDISNPSFFCFSPNREFLYCVNECQEFEGQPTGAVSAFRIEGDSGRLTLLNQQSSHGTDPCHVNVDRTGKYVFVTNYSSGSVSVYPINDDGSLGVASCVVQHEGRSVNPERQQGPHAHGVEISGDNRFVFVCDLGSDQLFVYEFDIETGEIFPNGKQAAIAVQPGAGPRHLVMHPNSKFAYLLNELNSTMTALKYDAENGVFEEIDTLSTLPAGFRGKTTCAEVQISPDGKFLYGSNRGHNSVVTYRIEDDGSIKIVGHEGTGGEVPRHFEIDPSGGFVAAANQDTGNIVMFKRCTATGELEPTGSVVEVGSPVCVRFL